MTFPPNINKAEKNQFKLQQLDQKQKSPHNQAKSIGPQTNLSKQIVTGVDFYKGVLSSD